MAKLRVASSLGDTVSSAKDVVPSGNPAKAADIDAEDSFQWSCGWPIRRYSAALIVLISNAAQRHEALARAHERTANTYQRAAMERHDDRAESAASNRYRAGAALNGFGGYRRTQP